MRSKENLKKVISDHFVAPYDRLFQSLIKSSFRLESKPNHLIQFGESKFGGNPHVKEKFDWPQNELGYPLTFICQINLDEINSQVLPENGYLYFFFDWNNIDFCQVIYRNSGAPKYILPMPLVNRDNSISSLIKNIFKSKIRIPRIRECKYFFSIEYYIPNQDSIYFEIMNEKYKIDKVPNSIYNEEVYEEGLLNNEGENEYTSQHRLLGNYTAIQSEYLETRFIKSKFKDDIGLYKEASKWKLLLQVDSDKNIRFTWGDLGRLYFFIHQDDLVNHNFSRVRITGDCY